MLRKARGQRVRSRAHCGVRIWRCPENAGLTGTIERHLTRGSFKSECAFGRAASGKTSPCQRRRAPKCRFTAPCCEAGLVRRSRCVGRGRGRGRGRRRWRRWLGSPRCCRELARGCRTRVCIRLFVGLCAPWVRPTCASATDAGSRIAPSVVSETMDWRVPPNERTVASLELLGIWSWRHGPSQ
jgi:hypothetical protein